MKTDTQWFRWIALPVLVAGWIGAVAQSEATPFPQWKEGELEIHQIASGMGESAFMILPDGTTLLLDIGSGKYRADEREVVTKADPEVSSPEYITNYIRRATPARRIDYLMLSHFHDDHIGNVADNRYYGVNLIEKSLPVGTLLDRGYPSYNYPEPLKGALMEHYKAVVEELDRSKRTRVERFQPGRADQVVLRNRPRQYADLFRLQNIASNGEVWTGVGTVTRQLFPDLKELSPRDRPSENQCSSALKLSYGKFDYYTGGDITGVNSPYAPQWNDVERPVALVTGPVEACVLNHHGYRDGTTEFFVSVLSPRIFIIPVWGVAHPDQTSLVRMMSQQLYPGPRDIYATDVHPANYLLNKRYVDGYKSRGGHIVIKVAPGGDTFTVYVLDNEKEQPAVKYRSEPYLCR